jgi:hypothetical protein
MKLDANGGDYGPYRDILVVLNATNEQVTFTDTSLQGVHLHLHPVQKGSSDMLTRQSKFDSKHGAATVGALTTAVFVRNE